VGVLMLEHPAFGPGDVGVGHAPQRERQRLDDEIIDGELVGWLALLVLGRRSVDLLPRSEERRVGKECRSRWAPYHAKKKATRPRAWKEWPVASERPWRTTRPRGWRSQRRVRRSLAPAGDRVGRGQPTAVRRPQRGQVRW